MICAVVNLEKKVVENLIVAESSDPYPNGYLLVGDPPEWVVIGTEWDGRNFVKPRDEGMETL